MYNELTNGDAQRLGEQLKADGVIVFAFGRGDCPYESTLYNCASWGRDDAHAKHYERLAEHLLDWMELHENAGEHRYG